MCSLLGLNILLLSTKGRFTENWSHVPLLYIESRGKYYCVASFGGSDRNPEWFLNLVKNGNVTLLLKRKRLNATAHVTSGSERSEIWKKLVDYYPNFAAYQTRTKRTIPVVRLVPAENVKTD